MEQWPADFFVGRQPRFARNSRDHDRRPLFWLHGWRWLELRRGDCVVDASCLPARVYEAEATDLNCLDAQVLVFTSLTGGLGEPPLPFRYDDNMCRHW